MQENSSNPPTIGSTISTPEPFDNDLPITDSQPSTTDIIVRDGLLRDMWVSLRRPCPISDATDPQLALANKIIGQFRKQGVSLDIDQVADTVELILGKKLVQYFPESRCYMPTQKTQRLMDALYIVFCDNCGASNIRLHEEKDEIPTLIFCHRCEEIV
jgi:hypothetical protein